MRFWSSLLLVTFSGVLTAAPAARLPHTDEHEKPRKAAGTGLESDADPAQEEKPRQDAAASRVVVLRGSEPGDEESGSDIGGPAVNFEMAPALRVRKLASARPTRLPHTDSISDADLRAGLIATPPPAA